MTVAVVENKRTGPDDYWKSQSFARRYVLNNIRGIAENPGAREFSATCFMAQVQGVQYLAPKVQSILDIGCGHATRAANLKAHFGCRVVAADYSEPFLEEARRISELLPEAHRSEIVQADAYELPFADNEFDVAVCYGLLMSLERPAQTDIMRVVKYGLVAIEECDRAMAPDQREKWMEVKDKTFPGRIYWHDYLKVFGLWRQIIYNPLPGPDSWSLGTPPGYARIIVVKEPPDA